MKSSSMTAGEYTIQMQRWLLISAEINITYLKTSQVVSMFYIQSMFHAVIW